MRTNEERLSSLINVRAVCSMHSVCRELSAISICMLCCIVKCMPFYKLNLWNSVFLARKCVLRKFCWRFFDSHFGSLIKWNILPVEVHHPNKMPVQQKSFLVCIHSFIQSSQYDMIWYDMMQCISCKKLWSSMRFSTPGASSKFKTILIVTSTFESLIDCKEPADSVKEKRRFITWTLDPNFCLQSFDTLNRSNWVFQIAFGLQFECCHCLF